MHVHVFQGTRSGTVAGHAGSSSLDHWAVGWPSSVLNTTDLHTLGWWPLWYVGYISARNSQSIGGLALLGVPAPLQFKSWRKHSLTFLAQGKSAWRVRHLHMGEGSEREVGGGFCGAAYAVGC